MPRTPFIEIGIDVRERYEPDDVVIRLRFAPTSPMTAPLSRWGDRVGDGHRRCRAAWSNHDFERGRPRRHGVAMSIQVHRRRQAWCDLLCHARAADAARNSLCPAGDTQPIQAGHRRSLCRPTGSSGTSCAERALRAEEKSPSGISPWLRWRESPWRKAVGRPTGNAVFQWDLEGCVQDRSDHSPCAYHRNEFDENHFVAM